MTPMEPAQISSWASKLALYRERPLVMVREMFGVEPDPWQADALEAYPRTPRMAMKACKGPGKTALLAWIGWNFLLTRPHAMIGATSISSDNLKANLWTELARWYQKNAALQGIFEMTKTEIFARDHPATWKLQARTWAKDADPTTIGNALSGLHAPYVMWLLDESGGYPDALMPTCEAIFAGSPIEAHIVQAGNPTHLSGPLYAACTRNRSSWLVIEITADPDDPKRSSRISVEHARQQIKDWGGRENAWVMVNILGKFPPASFNALIGPDEVAAAQKRFYRAHEIGFGTPIILSVDVARFGDDKSVIGRRQGIQMFPFDKRRGLDSIQGAGWVSRTWTDHNAAGCFIDMTGGYGAGWFDQLVVLGRSPIGVQYAGEAHAPDRYFNKRTEMAFDFVDWIKRGGAIPEDDSLARALIETTYTFKGDRLILEPKESVKTKIGFSPDEMDSGMQTFAEAIAAPAALTAGRVNRSAVPEPYKPFADLENDSVRSYGVD